mmetsp:Transcript_30157/g.69142  ORF Transcript_30157/g.69142 Transcript_30157/m.69142 type:complete len:272 (-) Transcript_30157:34-849(-)
MKTGEDQRPFDERNRRMNSPRDERSRSMSQNSAFSCGPLPSVSSASFAFLDRSRERLNPVPIGSMKTRSVNPSHVSSLSTTFVGGGGSSPFVPRLTLLGPSAPMCMYADAAPGPPLNTNVIGRDASPGWRKYAVKNISATGLLILRRVIQSATALYFRAFSPSPMVCSLSNLLVLSGLSAASGFAAGSSVFFAFSVMDSFVPRILLGRKGPKEDAVGERRRRAEVRRYRIVVAFIFTNCDCAMANGEHDPQNEDSLTEKEQENLHASCTSL